MSTQADRGLKIADLFREAQRLNEMTESAAAWSDPRTADLDFVPTKETIAKQAEIVAELWDQVHDLPINDEGIAKILQKRVDRGQVSKP